MTFLVAVLAFALAAVITRYEHHRSPPGYWGQRIGRSRWRRANLPAGGALMLLAAFEAAAVFSPAVPYFLAAAVAMSAAAILGRFIDPLPPP